MTQYVVDASVAIKWFVDEIYAEAARRLQEDENGLLAPDLLWPECGNILWQKVRRGELTADEARLIWGGLEQQPINIFLSGLVLEPALKVAVDTNRTVYDGCYLALAMLTGWSAGDGRWQTLQRPARRELCPTSVLGCRAALTLRSQISPCRDPILARAMGL